MRNVILLGITSLLMDISSEIIHTSLPAFLFSIGIGGLGVGVISGIGEFLANFLKAIFGEISDKIKKKKPLILLGYFVSSISKCILSFAKNISEVVLYRSLDRAGKGIRTAPRDSLISLSSKDRTGFGFGIHRAMDTIGAIVGSLLVILLYPLGFRKLFIIASFIAFFSLIPILFVEEVNETRRSEKEGSLKNLLPLIIFSFSSISYIFFLYEAVEKAGEEISFYLYLLFNIVYALFSIPFGEISDRIGKKAILMSSYLLYSIVLISFSIPTSYFISFFLYGLFFSMKDGVERAYVSEFVGRSGRAYGLYHFLIGTSSLASNIVFGFLLSALNEKAFLIYLPIPILSAFMVMKIEK